jgi:2-furoyl-CoA dehydrogenase FAD binding subunit
MKPARFEYVRPETLEEALAALAENGDEAKVLAGGQSLVPALNMRLLRPAVLVDVNRIPGLDSIDEVDDEVRVGALVRQVAMERSPLVRSRVPLAAEALPHVGHFVTRNRGTVGGSIAHADAAAELPLALVATTGTIVAASTRGRRTIPADEFFLGPYATALEPDELVVETIWPRAGDGMVFAFEEFAQRAGDYALAMTAVCVQGDELRVAVGSVVDRPTLLEVDPEHPGESAAAQVEPWGSIHASPAYLKQLVRVLVDRAVTGARARESAAS